MQSTAPSTNFGTSGQLGVDNSPVKRSFLRFTVSGLVDPVTNAKLRIHADDVSGAESDNGGTFRSMKHLVRDRRDLGHHRQRDLQHRGDLAQQQRRLPRDRRHRPATGGLHQHPAPPGDPVLVGAGDIADCSNSGDSATAALLDNIPGTVYTTGDNVYPNGTLSEFNNCYGPTWGRHKARTRPAPGNHDYNTSGATGYFGYFGSLAGPSGQGYYSYDLGTWHWHKPRFTSGANPLWQALYDFNAEVVLAGHNHQYERFAPQNAAGNLDTARGIREFVSGAGGESHYSFGSTQPNSEVRNGDTFCVLKLTLHANSYDWQFVPEAGKTFTDTGTNNCH